jgi:hypothetical protein
VGRRRVDLKEAAEIFDTTTEAIRKRAKRGTLDSETGEDGRVYVWVDVEDERVDDQVDGGVDGIQGVLIERMSSEIEHLRSQLQAEREANRENRRLLAAALERIPAIEAPTEPPPETRDSPETVSGEETRGSAPSGDTGDSRSSSEAREPWWRRWFGG